MVTPFGATGTRMGIYCKNPIPHVSVVLLLRIRRNLVWLNWKFRKRSKKEEPGCKKEKH